jgi:CheY-like chemotaxis protein
MLLDASLPDLDGFTLAHPMAGSTSASLPPIIGMALVGKFGDTSQWQAAGITTHLSKPVKRSQLHEVLLALSVRSSEETVTSHPARIMSPRLPGAELTPCRILVAEDNISNQKLIMAALQRLGHRVDLAANGYEAIQAVTTVPYDLVLMDVEMPEMDGYAATHHIRQSGNGAASVPIIAMTAHALVEHRARCLDAGMDDYIAKPVQLRALSSLIEHWCGRTHTAWPAPATPAPAVAPTTEPMQ